ncbi:hypothetical protein OEZ86_014662 [Tetradesmus obliquus]|nr:hypothetical protein OEZ86_014662 [Tetradesmus obliquus]
MSWDTPGLHVAHWAVNGWKVVTTTNMAVIFFIFGVTLDTSELLLALKAWKAIIFGLVSMLVICPLFGFICMLLPFKPYEFALGLAVMACVPTSLSSGVTLVIGAYGNGALALLFTVTGNILGIITSPLAVKVVLGSRTDAHVDSGDLLVKLGVSILMPVLVGKATRELIKPIRDNVAKYKVPLYLINNLQITMIVWQKLSSARSVLVEQDLGDVLLAGLAAIVLHFVFLFTNILLSWLLRFPEKERKAIIVMGSQKNLPTAAVIISYFDAAAVGNLGLMTIPCIVFYIMQLFIDAFIASGWAGKYERLALVQASYNEQLKQLEENASSTDLAGKVAAKVSTGGAAGGTASEGGVERIAAGYVQAAFASEAAVNNSRPARTARLSAARGSTDSDDMGQLQNVELCDVNPLLERS